MAGPAVFISIDATDLQSKIERLRMAMQKQQFENAMHGIFRRVDKHVKKIMRTDLPPQYYVKPAQAAGAVGAGQVSFGGGGNVGCVIPIRGPKNDIGGGMFKASGGAHGWNSRYRKYRVKARIVKAAVSTLPATADSYGGEPPFRNLGSSLGGLTFTRAGEDRLPIEKMVGIAIPQMPMNRSREAVEADLHEWLAKQIDDRIRALMATGR